MSTIMIKTDDVIRQAEKITKFAEKEKETLVKLNRTILSLAEIWRGDSQDAIVVQFAETKAKADKFITEIEEYAKAMDKKAREFSDVENDTCIKISMVDIA